MIEADRRVYGSERHLLRYLGRHRAELDRRVLEVTGAGAIAWLDFPFDASKPWLDGEWKGMDFLPASDPARHAWRSTWPSSGNAQNWDAVARLHVGAGTEWLLVEAKAHTGEIASSCMAKGEGRRMIAETLEAVKDALGVQAGQDWLNGHYQLANRVAALHFLNRAGAAARLLLVYFTGDANPAANCPSDAAGWDLPLARQQNHLGLAPDHPLAGRIHKLFLPVVPVRVEVAA